MIFTFLEFKLLKEDLITKSFLKNFLKKKIIILKNFNRFKKLYQIYVILYVILIN